VVAKAQDLGTSLTREVGRLLLAAPQVHGDIVLIGDVLEIEARLPESVGDRLKLGLLFDQLLQFSL
jgi:hypothetical protein